MLTVYSREKLAANVEGCSKTAESLSRFLQLQYVPGSLQQGQSGLLEAQAHQRSAAELGPWLKCPVTEWSAVEFLDSTFVI